ncbi:MAG: c-type cytochrome biogenesis protein CcmI [Alphaproteobacteria bacterium]|nr:MAG: c-type cytochrome biogenesis protein CcmI [Alphaproteobacteria bacterium]
MLFWLLVGVLAVVVAGTLLLALTRRPPPSPPRAEHDLEVFRAQLRELERDVEAGRIGPDEARAARTEIQRRMLNVTPGSAADAAPGSASGAPGRRSTAASPAWPTLALAFVVPGVALGLYLWLGNPGTPSVETPARPLTVPGTADGGSATAEQRLPDVETMMARLEARLADNPDDLAGWITLARSAAAIGQFERALDAYDRAVALAPEVADIHSGRGEILTVLAGGAPDARARAAFRKALELDPGNARARYYMALASEQDGNPEAALEALIALLRDAPADAPWRAPVRAKAAAIASALGKDPDAVLPPPAAGAATADAGGSAPVHDAAAVARLEARLNENPKDYQGWIALAEARAAQGDKDAARAALQRGREVYKGAPFVQQQLARAARRLGLDEAGDAGSGPRGPSAEDVEAAREMSPQEQLAMIRSMVSGLAERLKSTPEDLKGWRMLARSYAVLGERPAAAQAYRHVLSLVPEDPDALYFLGEEAERQGERAQALDYWSRLLAQLPPGSADHAQLKSRIERLQADR